MNNKSIGNIFKGDKVIWMVFFFLCMISIVEVYSASSSLSYKTGNYMAPVIRHILLLGGGLFTMICMLKVKCKYFKIVTPVVMGISLLLLVLVLATGQSTNGASRWFRAAVPDSRLPAGIASGVAAPPAVSVSCWHSGCSYVPGAISDLSYIRPDSTSSSVRERWHRFLRQ